MLWPSYGSMSNSKKQNLKTCLVNYKHTIKAGVDCFILNHGWYTHWQHLHVWLTSLSSMSTLCPHYVHIISTLCPHYVLICYNIITTLSLGRDEPIFKVLSSLWHYMTSLDFLNGANISWVTCHLLMYTITMILSLGYSDLNWDGNNPNTNPQNAGT